MKDNNGSLDIEAAWTACGKASAPSPQFSEKLTAAFDGYFAHLIPMQRTSNQKRKSQFAKIQTLSKRLLTELNSLPDDLAYEVTNAYMLNEPEDYFENSFGKDHEGLDYWEYEFDGLKTTLETLSTFLDESLDTNPKPGGRPKQNENLEETIIKLSTLFAATSGKDAAKGISVSTYSGGHAYGGPFIDFLQVAFWSFNAREYPSSAAIGETARRALGLRNKGR